MSNKFKTSITFLPFSFLLRILHCLPSAVFLSLAYLALSPLCRFPFFGVSCIVSPLQFSFLWRIWQCLPSVVFLYFVYLAFSPFFSSFSPPVKIVSTHVSSFYPSVTILLFCGASLIFIVVSENRTTIYWSALWGFQVLGAEF